MLGGASGVGPLCLTSRELGWRMVLYGESAEVSSHSLARWPLHLQVAQTWRNLHDPGKAHCPLFHEEQIRSNVSQIGLLAFGSRQSLQAGLVPDHSDMTVAEWRLAFNSFHG